MSLTNEDSRKRKKRAKRRAEDTARQREIGGERPLLSNTQQCENHEFDNSGPDLARRGQVPNELGVGKVSSAFKLCGHF